MGTDNSVEIPITSIEDALVQCAVPGFWGQLIVEVRLLKTAALEVELHAERKTVTQTEPLTRDSGPVVPSNERVSKVRSRLAEIQAKLRLLCPVTTIRASFKDGHMVSCEVTEREQLDQPKMLPQPMARNTKVI